MEKSSQSTAESLKGVFTLPSMVLYVQLLLCGLLFGVKDSYLYIYIQEELGGDANMICKNHYSTCI